METTSDTDVAYHDRGSVLLADGSVLGVSDAIAGLPWQPMLCPTMPHQYVVSTWSSVDRQGFGAILQMIDHSPDTVLAYWRGYQWPTRYWHGPNGFRYWTTPGFRAGSVVINRTDDTDDTRPVALGGKPIRGLGRVSLGAAGRGAANLRASRVARRLVADRCRPRSGLQALPVMPTARP